MGSCKIPAEQVKPGDVLVRGTRSLMVAVVLPAGGSGVRFLTRRLLKSGSFGAYGERRFDRTTMVDVVRADEVLA